MTVAYIVLTIVAAFSAFTSGMAAGVQMAGIYGAKFTYGPLLGPSWTWFWVDVAGFTVQTGIMVLASHRAISNLSQ